MRTDQGQALPGVALCLVLAVLAAAAVGRLGARAAVRARAAAAAEAVALAAAQAAPGTDAERAAAAAAAAGNGARVERLEDQPDATVLVTVSVNGNVARARASRGEDVVDAGLRAAMARSAQLLGHPLAVVRVDAAGLAVEVGAPDAAALVALGGGSGLCPVKRPTGAAMFEVCAVPSLGTIGNTSEHPVRSLSGTSTVGEAPESEPAEE